MPTLLYSGNKNPADGTFNLEVASGVVPMGTQGVFTALEAAQLGSLYYLQTPGSAGVAVTNGPPTVQTITIYDYDGDSAILTFGGQSVIIPTNSTGPDVQKALQALSSIGAGNATVTGPEGGPWVVTFAGTLADSVQAAIAASGLDMSTTADTSHDPYVQ